MEGYIMQLCRRELQLSRSSMQVLNQIRNFCHRCGVIVDDNMLDISCEHESMPFFRG